MYVTLFTIAALRDDANGHDIHDAVFARGNSVWHIGVQPVP
jgi:hypothetical protein